MIRSVYRASISTFNKAVIRRIDSSIVDYGLVLHKNDKVNLPRAIEQHDNMKNILTKLGLMVHELPSDGFPDSVFIEDTAVVIDNTVLITNPGAKSRRGEVKAVKEFFSSEKTRSLRYHVLEKGTLDGGDVLFTGKSEIFVGLSGRTNHEGIRSLSRAFPRYDVTIIDMAEFQRDIPKADQVLHLKSFCSVFGPDKILVGGFVGARFQSFLAERFHWITDMIPAQRMNFDIESNQEKLPNEFPMYDVVHVPDIAASNCVYVNGTIIRRATEEFPESGIVFETHDSLRNVPQVEVVYDELAKVDGALTCCSVLMRA